MKYLFSILTLIFFITVIVVYVIKLDINPDNSLSAYYNTSGAFAGFIQKKNGLIRACEFSTNGAILSCSKWFDEKLLKQGKNEGLSIEDI